MISLPTWIIILLSTWGILSLFYFVFSLPVIMKHYHFKGDDKSKGNTNPTQ
jgi:hypothetical protein